MSLVIQFLPWMAYLRFGVHFEYTFTPISFVQLL